MSFPPFPGNYAKNPYGFSPPSLGGDMGVMTFAITFGMVAATTAFVLPAGSTIVGFDLAVSTVFNNTPLLSVGHTGANTFYLNAVAVLAATGPVYSTAWDVSKWHTRLNTPETINILVGGTPNQGAAVLVCRYIMI